MRKYAPTLAYLGFAAALLLIFAVTAKADGLLAMASAGPVIGLF